MHLYICCKTLSDDNVLFIKNTTSHISIVIPRDNILPTNKINPSFLASLDFNSILLIASLTSFLGKFSFLRLIHITPYFINSVSSFINFSKHKDISLILSHGKNQI